jgi:UDP-2,4-diacetamido-2,4,6-trideoxy-beta-L-altropyranose hydrolase
MTRWVIRADASLHIGAGHVIRCLTLAQQIEAHGDADIRFICRDTPGHLAGLIRGHGYEVTLLTADTHSFSWQLDAGQVLDSLGEDTIDWLVVDHYDLDSRWETMIRGKAKRILAIDDLANRPHDCDALLDQNYRLNLERRYDGLLRSGCTALLGPRYLLLRPEFTNARKTLQRNFSKVSRILVNFGGTDEPNVSLLAIRAIRSLQRPGLMADVVIGQTNPHQAVLRQEVSQLPGCTLHVQTQRMAELVCAADIAIGASGSSTWERCCLGLPTLSLVLADNQREAAGELGEAGIIVNLGEAGDMSMTALAAELDKLIKDPARRMALSSRSIELVPRDQPSIPQILMQGLAQKGNHDA